MISLSPWLCRCLLMLLSVRPRFMKQFRPTVLFGSLFLNLFENKP